MRKFSYLFTIVAVSFAAMMSFAVVSCGDDEKENLNPNGNNYGQDDDPTKVDTTTVNAGYLDPITAWGSSMQQVKSYMKDYEVLYEGSDYIVFNGKGIETAYYYDFDDSKLCISEVDLELGKISKSTLQSKLSSDGYTFLNSKDTTDFYVSNDEKTFVLLSTSNYYGVYELVYIDYKWLDEDEEPSEAAEYFEPYTVWGASASQIKNYMRGYEVYYEEEDYLVFEGTGITTGYYYGLDNSELCYSEVDIDMEKASKASVIAKLENDGFEFIAEEDTTAYFISSDEKTLINLNTSDYYGVYEVNYISYEWLMGDEDDDDDNNQSLTTYFAPTTNWGASKSQVKNYMKNYEIYDESNNSLIYYGSGNSFAYYYGFEQSKLYIAEVDLNPDSINLNSIGNQLINDGYQYMENQDTVYYFMASDSKSVVALYVSEYYGDYEVVYYDYEWMMSQYGTSVKGEVPTAAMIKSKSSRLSLGNIRTEMKNHRIINMVSSLLSTRCRKNVRVSKYVRFNNIIAAKRENILSHLRR